MISVKLRNIVKAFAQTVAVDSIDLDIKPGELFFLLGPSGCGKTTILRMIAGLIQPNTGSISFDNRDITNLPTGKRNCAMVFQSYALWPHMTVAQNVSFGLDVRKIPANDKQKQVTDALRRVKMLEYASRRPMQLSGGQQQRVALARALVVNPDVLLLDEPLSNLDAKLRAEMRLEIRRICKEANITTIYVTHDQVEALSMADRVALMNQGRLCQVAPPSEIYNRPANRFAADFLGTTNFIPAVVVEHLDSSLKLESSTGPVTSNIFPDDVPAKGNVTCSIRPEAIRILNPDEHADNSFAGKHLETVYLGDVARHTFELKDGLKLHINEPKPSPRAWPDTPTNLGFNADDVVVLTN